MITHLIFVIHSHKYFLLLFYSLHRILWHVEVLNELIVEKENIDEHVGIFWLLKSSVIICYFTQNFLSYAVVTLAHSWSHTGTHSFTANKSRHIWRHCLATLSCVCCLWVNCGVSRKVIRTLYCVHSCTQSDVYTQFFLMYWSLLRCFTRVCCLWLLFCWTVASLFVGASVLCVFVYCLSNVFSLINR